MKFIKVTFENSKHASIIAVDKIASISVLNNGTVVLSKKTDKGSIFWGYVNEPMEYFENLLLNI